ncbi:MAG TPA: right-handed parallel beta-helix repeat-containing protein, partial [Nevskiaceae bacterium]|nr:right-handed parallel beta-helix repeat-containing protein [Nevskiaceae bacterium]
VGWTRDVALETIIDGNKEGSVVKLIEGSDGAVLDGFTLRNGEANSGGGVYVLGTSVAIRQCQVISNTARDGGGGINLLYATATIDANFIFSNSVEARGGGGMVIDRSLVTATNNVIAFNKGELPYRGDGIYVWGNTARAQIVNNTILSNSGEAIEAMAGAEVWLRNNIITGNQGGLFNFLEEATFFSDYNLFWNNGWMDYSGVTPGPRDISADPLLVDPENGDYHLQVSSPCIDAGTNDGALSTDFDGDPRPDGCWVDIGADELALGRGCDRIYLPLVLVQR